MIRKLFLPDIIRGKRYFSESVITLSLEGDIIRCAIVRHTSKGIRLEKVLDYPLPQEEQVQTGTKQTSHELEKLLSLIAEQAEKHDRIRLVIPSESTILREIELPFSSPEKIKMVVGYEVEGMLPFQVSDAIIDVIIPEETTPNGTTQTLVVAAQNSVIKKHLSFWQPANIIPNNITTDLLCLYGLTTHRQNPGNQALIYFDRAKIKIAFMENNQIRSARTLSHGLDQLQAPPQDNPEEFMQKMALYGVLSSTDESYNNQISKRMGKIAKEISFALDSFSIQVNMTEPIENVLIIQQAAPIKGLNDYMSKALNIPCSPLSLEPLIADKKIINNATSNAQSLLPYLLVIGAAIPPKNQIDFNLGGHLNIQAAQPLIKKQLMAGFFLIVGIAIALGLDGYIHISSLSQKAHNFENKATAELKKLFPKNYRLPRRSSLKRLIKEADGYIADRQTAWKNYGSQELPALNIMLEMTRLIDRNKYDVVMDSFIMSNDESGQTVVAIKGSMKTKEDRVKEFKEFAARLHDSKKLIVQQFDGVYDDQSNSTQFTGTLRLETV